jgi:hypothetical protein
VRRATGLLLLAVGALAAVAGVFGFLDQANAPGGWVGAIAMLIGAVLAMGIGQFLLWRKRPWERDAA